MRILSERCVWGQVARYYDGLAAGRRRIVSIRKHVLQRETGQSGLSRRQETSYLHVHLINPSHLAFGVGVITPRWLYVLAAATPRQYGDPLITDETLEVLDPSGIQPGDVVGIGIHTGNALRGYEVGRVARERGAWVVFGGIHATLFPEEPAALGGAPAVVKGDGG